MNTLYLARADVLAMKNAIINQEDDVIGGLLDSYVAGYWAQNKDNFATPLKDPLLRVGTVFDHQFAYGFVIAGAFEKNEEFEKCSRKKLNSMETDITKIIQADAKTMEVGLWSFIYRVYIYNRTHLRIMSMQAKENAREENVHGANVHVIFVSGIRGQRSCRKDAKPLRC